jgi:hypothetical protein
MRDGYGLEAAKGPQRIDSGPRSILRAAGLPVFLGVPGVPGVACVSAFLKGVVQLREPYAK